MQTHWLLTSRSFLLAVILHAGLGLIFLFGLEFSPKPTPKKTIDVDIVKAVSVDKNQVEQEVKRLKDIEKKKAADHIKQQQQLAKIKQQRVQEEKALRDLKKKKQAAEQKRIAEEKRLKKLAQEKIERDKKEAEAKRKQAEKQQREAALQKALDAEAEQVRQKEKERQQREEAKKKAEEAAVKKALEAKQKARQDQADQQQITSYSNAIKRAIRDEFNTSGLSKGLSCDISIHILAGGKVTNVTITRSSGNKLFDQRAENAVYAASVSGLSVPDEARLFKKFTINNMIVIEFTP